jgi:TctA family transporter
MTASQGSPLVFFSRPSAAALGIAAISVWLLPALGAWRARR